MKKLLNRKSKSIAGAAIILAIASIFSRFLGIIRDRVLAGQFGAGAELDIYYAAFRIPDLIYNLLVLGAISAGFIPILSELLNQKKSKEKGWEFSNNILNHVFLITAGVSLLGIIFAPQLMKILAPGFSSEQLSTLVDLSRLMFLSPVFLSLSSVFGAVLQTFRSFVAYSLAPSLYNLGIIFGALFLAPNWGIYGLTYGVILGAFLHALIQFVAAKQVGFNYSWVLDRKDKSFVKLLKLMIPRTFALATVQLNLVVITVIASTLPEGSLSVFNFANNIQYFPIGVFGISLALAAFPSLSEATAKGNHEKFKQDYSETFGKILFYILPASVVLYLLSPLIVNILLGGGEFDSKDLYLTVVCLQVFCFSLFAQGLLPLLSRAFYAHHNTKIPTICAFLAFIANIFLAFSFSQKWGIVGLVLAFSVSSLFNWLLLQFSVRTYLDVKLTDLSKTDIHKMIWVNIFLFFISKHFLGWLNPNVESSLLNSFLNLIYFSFLFGVMYWIFSRLLKISYEKELFDRFFRKRK